jgi:hypothetical protein
MIPNSYLGILLEEILDSGHFRINDMRGDKSCVEQR